ncbi:MAG: hypothetical protein ACUVS4_10385 [Chloroflexaceae bacterium]
MTAVQQSVSADVPNDAGSRRRGASKNPGNKARESVSNHPVAIRSIWMSDRLMRNLSFVSKINRDPAFLTALITDGEMQGEAFLVQRESAGC